MWKAKTLKGLDRERETFPNRLPGFGRPQTEQHLEVAFNVAVSHDAGHRATLLAHLCLRL
jgi:hypothetical protein